MEASAFAGVFLLGREKKWILLVSIKTLKVSIKIG